MCLVLVVLIFLHVLMSIGNFWSCRVEGYLGLGHFTCAARVPRCEYRPFTSMGLSGKRFTVRPVMMPPLRPTRAASLGSDLPSQLDLPRQTGLFWAFKPLIITISPNLHTGPLYWEPLILE